MNKKILALFFVFIMTAAIFGYIFYKEETRYDIDYEFPLDLEGVHSFNKIDEKLSMNSRQRDILRNNGIVVLRSSAKYDEFAPVYEKFKEEEIPIFVSSDAVLHAFHVIYDESLSQLEEKYLDDQLYSLTTDLLTATADQLYNAEDDMQELIFLNQAYLYLGSRLLQPEMVEHNNSVSSELETLVEKELALVEAHEGIQSSYIFPGANIDYSRFVPRGHYDRSDDLKRYFKAMTWFNLASFHLETYPESVLSGAVNNETRRAVLLVDLFEKAESTAKEKWQMIYDATVYYVGAADALTWLELQPLVDKYYPGLASNYSVLDDNETLVKFQVETASLKQQMISVDTKGRSMQMFGERYVPDSYIMDTLTDYPERLIGSGLDVMAVLGSETADELLSDEKERVSWYSERQEDLIDEFSNYTDETWEQNLYWSWLDCLRSNMETAGEVKGAPEFMRSDAWKYKALNTNLASWTELRHDTILYASQYYPPCSAEPDYKGVGYVEPLPELYDKIQELSQKMKEQLEGRLITEGFSYYRDFDPISALEHLDSTCSRLSQISRRELNNEPITKEDVYFIRGFAYYMLNMCGEGSSEYKETVLVADVGTDPNTNTCHEVGVGYLDIAVVTFTRPDGEVYSAAGPVFSFYEFTQPIDNRLTDSAWRTMLDSSPPDRPEWSEKFSA